MQESMGSIIKALRDAELGHTPEGWEYGDFCQVCGSPDTVVDKSLSGVRYYTYCFSCKRDSSV